MIRDLAEQQGQIPYSRPPQIDDYRSERRPVTSHRGSQRSDRSHAPRRYEEYAPSSQTPLRPVREYSSDISQGSIDERQAAEDEAERKHWKLVRDESKQMDMEATMARQPRRRNTEGSVASGSTSVPNRRPVQGNELVRRAPSNYGGHGTVTSVAPSHNSRSGYGSADEDLPRDGSLFGGHRPPTQSAIASPALERPPAHAPRGFDEGTFSEYGGYTQNRPGNDRFMERPPRRFVE
jgi:hypothetical protein